MNPRLVPPLPAGCPWSGWALPDMKHCEANACAWITAPANTWSNLVYFAVGAWIMKRSTRTGLLSARGLGPVSVLVGATSFAFHASYTFAGQFLDYAGMFALTGWSIARALLRDGRVGETGAARVWAGLFAGSLAALLGFRALGWGVQTIMLVHAVSIVVLEVRLMLVRRDAPSYAPFWLMQGLLLVAYGAWHLDHSDAACRPDSPFQLHALWHVLTAAAFVAAWRFHEGVDSARDPR